MVAGPPDSVEDRVPSRLRQGRGDAGDVQDPGSAQQFVWQVRPAQPGRGAPGPVVVNADLSGQALVPEHDAGEAVVPNGVHVDALAAKTAFDHVAGRVATKPPGPD